MFCGRAITFALALAGCLDYGALERGTRADLETSELATPRDFAKADLVGVDLAGADLAIAPDMVQTGVSCGGSGVAGTCTTIVGLTYLFCDDFESGVVAPARWPTQTVTGGATLGTDTTRSCRGLVAARFTTPSSGSGDVFIQTGSFGGTGPAFARAYFYFTVPGSESDLLELSDSSNHNVGLYLHLGQWALREGNTPRMASMTGPAAATWICVELEVAPGSPSSVARVFVNDVPVTGLTVPVGSFGQLSKLRLGLRPTVGMLTQPQGDLDVDEVAVANTYIPCYD